MKISILKKQRLIFGFVIALFLSFSFSACVSAQSKIITYDEFETVKNNADQKLGNISYRSVTFEVLGMFQRFETNILCEFVPPDRKYCTSKVNIIGLTKTNSDNPQKADIRQTYDERIYIGEKSYYRNGANKEWEEISPDLIGETDSGASEGGAFKTAEYKLTPNQFVSGQETDFYEVVISRKYSGKSEPLVETYKYWINKNGLFVKTQHLDSIPKITTVDYIYSSNIKIEAPLIRKGNKKQ